MEANLITFSLYSVSSNLPTKTSGYARPTEHFAVPSEEEFGARDDGLGTIICKYESIAVYLGFPIGQRILQCQSLPNHQQPRPSDCRWTDVGVE